MTVIIWKSIVPSVEGTKVDGVYTTTKCVNIEITSRKDSTLRNDYGNIWEFDVHTDFIR